MATKVSTSSNKNTCKYLVDGRFKLIQIVGEGSQGKVYKVEDLKENLKV